MRRIGGRCQRGARRGLLVHGGVATTQQLLAWVYPRGAGRDRLEKSTLGFSDKTIQRIMKESKGYPFLIQYICKEVFDAWIGKMTVGLAASVPMAEITAKLDQDFFAPRWSRATDRQQTFMQVIATLTSSDASLLAGTPDLLVLASSDTGSIPPRAASL
jgi:hypothetical protein